MLRRPAKTRTKVHDGKTLQTGKYQIPADSSSTLYSKKYAVPSFSLDIFGGLHLYFVAKYDFSCGSYVSARLS